MQKRQLLLGVFLILNVLAVIASEKPPKQYLLAVVAGKDLIDLPKTNEVTPQSTKTITEPRGLADLVALSLQQSPHIRSATAQFETAEARFGAVRAEVLPNLSLRKAKGPETSVSSLDAIEPSGSNKHTTRTAAVRLTQPLINVAAYNELASSRQSKDAMELRMLAAREATALNATRATIDLAVTRITLDLLDRQLEQLKKILSYLEARALAGASSQADLERARTRALATRQMQLEQQTNYRNAMFEIERLTGLMPDALYLPFLEMFLPLPARNDQIRQLIQDQNYDLLALRKEVNAQKSTVRSELSKYLPVVGISLEKDRTENVRGINAPWTDTRALVVMNWAISLGGKEYYAAKQASAELRNREAKLDEETQRIHQATEADMALLNAASMRLETANAEQNSAFAVVKAVDEQLKSGRIGSLLEALDASDRLYGAQYRLTQALGQQMKAHAQLLSRIGLLSEIQTQSKL